MRTTDMKQRIGLTLSEDPIRMTPQLEEQFLDSLESAGRQTQTIRTYRHSLRELYDFLPADKEINTNTLEEWKESLKARGYSNSTVNLRLTSVNGFLRFCGREELSTAHEQITPNEYMPELSREEYLQFLSKMREFGAQKYYFLIKVFGSLNLIIGDLEYLTVEACREGKIVLPDGETEIIPDCLKEELLQYAKRRQIKSGPIFVTRNGSLMNRSNITNAIRRLAIRAEMDPEKCCPSALHRLYIRTQKELIDRLQPIYLQSYENLLNTEQMMVAWKE